MPRPTGEKEATGELHPPFLRSGKVVSNRWKISHRLGAGTFGEVYAADDRELKTTVALKIELNNVANEEGLLKMEVEVLKELASRPHTPQLFASGKRAAFTYIVISRCGIDLHKVKKESGIPHLSDATVLRLAVHALYAMKQVHEIGYLHRDVKPSNMVFGATVVDSKILYLIDYGLARRYAEKDAKTGKWMFRKARDKAEVRGTSSRYCSLNIHLKSEQSRADDMWAFVYSMIDLGPGLPWPKQARDDRVQRMKEEISDEKMLGGKLECFQPIMAHIRKMKFYDRPDYKFIYEKLIESLKKKRVQFEDPYDWEGKSSSKNTGSWQASLHTADGSDSGSAKESQSNRNLSEKGAKKNPTSPSPVPQYPTILTKHFEFQDSDVPSGDPKGPKMVPPSKRKGFVKKTVESEFLI
ncbi:hypothetical protein L596_015541 [Steinernema carpocapsae]|uniref:non-specific serine/threonine protein kinase n=1 Tax=Steinernema carpocapsae TaxID=34508 RepID=A0A4U5NGJ5_STECR|nr:hypothetical protein L596_015541 [Steinernema carpocapsae]